MKLIIKHLGKIVSETSLEAHTTYSAGRSQDCDFILEDETLSRNHLKIYKSDENENWLVECVSDRGGLFYEAEEVEGVELDGSGTVTLQSYTFEFVKTKEAEEEVDGNLPAVNSDDDEKSKTNYSSNLEKSNITNTRTAIEDGSSIIYSLYVYIDGKIVDHIDLFDLDDWTLGRSDECDICIDYKILSREHLRIKKLHNEFTIQDLGSSNGSLLNDKDMAPNKEYPFQANDTVKISELKIIFEVRNTEFENMVDNLPALVSEEEESSEEADAIMPFPKVVLEEATPEEEEHKKSQKAKKFLNPKRLIFFGIFGVVAAGLIYVGMNDKEEGPTPEDIQRTEQSNKIKKSYELAVQFSQEKKYQFCIEELNRLHSITPYYLDSKQLFTQCETAAFNQKQQEAMEAEEQQKKETQAKADALAAECLAKKDTFETVYDLKPCARPVLDLDPTNNVIASIQRELEEKELERKMQQEQKESYQQMVQSKRALYRQAENAKERAKKAGVGNEYLKAIASYQRFMRSAKGVKAVAKQYAEAQAQIAAMQKEYDDTLNNLYAGCDKLVANEKWKQAYYTCRDVLKFKDNDKKILKNMATAKNKLRESLKTTYEESVLAESLSSISTAQKLWREIVEKDIKNGYYHKKASSLLKKYE